MMKAGPTRVRPFCYSTFDLFSSQPLCFQLEILKLQRSNERFMACIHLSEDLIFIHPAFFHFFKYGIGDKVTYGFPLLNALAYIGCADINKRGITKDDFRMSGVKGFGGFFLSPVHIDVVIGQDQFGVFPFIETLEIITAHD